MFIRVPLWTAARSCGHMFTTSLGKSDPVPPCVMSAIPYWREIIRGAAGVWQSKMSFPPRGGVGPARTAEVGKRDRFVDAFDGVAHALTRLARFGRVESRCLGATYQADTTISTPAEYSAAH